MSLASVTNPASPRESTTTPSAPPDVRGVEEIVSDVDQLEEAFAEFMSRYSVKSTAPVAVEAAVVVPEVVVPAKPAPPVRSASSKSNRESHDSVRQLRNVANEITRSVLESHQDAVSTKRMAAYMGLAFVTCAISLSAALTAQGTISPLYILGLAFYIVSMLLTYSLSSEWEKVQKRAPLSAEVEKSA